MTWWLKTQLMIETDQFGDTYARLYFVDEELNQCDWTIAAELPIGDEWEANFMARLNKLHNDAIDRGEIK